eukprot:TRINITY_DN72520_c0_g1_i1.p1 TRINITY_DN72520_c0_g1~~TRINITY_DN72520_c0_g1_i1.p1  ORF type:complete len:157 (+),score=28.26 TRINITY_DN72520_c0_g1_i1:65-472(+)
MANAAASRKRAASLGDAFRIDEGAPAKLARQASDGSPQTSAAAAALAAAAAMAPSVATTAKPVGSAAAYAASAPPPAPSLPGSAGVSAEMKTVGGSFLHFCWLCKRKFKSQNHLDAHALYSKMHQASIRRLAGLE